MLPNCEPCFEILCNALNDTFWPASFQGTVGVSEKKLFSLLLLIMVECSPISRSAFRQKLKKIHIDDANRYLTSLGPRPNGRSCGWITSPLIQFCDLIPAWYSFVNTSLGPRPNGRSCGWITSPLRVAVM